jgi:trehalose synthase-fused probable maltokinase
MSVQPAIDVLEWDRPFSDERALQSLGAVLPDYVSARRWYRSKARTICRLTVVDSIPAAIVGAFILVIRIEYQDGAPDAYFVPVAVARPGDAAALDEPVCTLRGPDGREGVLHGVLSNATFRQALLDVVVCERAFKGRYGTLIGQRTEALDAVCGEGALELESFVSRAEQSNTSVIYGDRYILKLFRKLEQGINPDIEIGTFLTRRGFRNTPAVLGQIEYRLQNREAYTAGILQQFVRNQGDAWSYTLRSLGGFFERALAARSGPPEVPQDLLGEYAASAALLGKRTAQMHAAFEDENGGPDFVPEPFTGRDREKLYQDLLGQADIAFELLRRKQAILTGSRSEAAREVLHLEPEVTARFNALRESPVSALRIRHHGDYHLGQVLYTGDDFMIIDFEGEPARSLSERRQKALAMRDVAGMLRSFHYAAYAALFETSARATLESWTAAWTGWVSAMYWKAYLSEGRGLRCIPSGASEQKLLLDAFLLQKALYEVAYELNNRPDWVHIPLRGILSLMSPERAALGSELEA